MTTLIALHGKISSGKDLTANIIQYLTDHRINTTNSDVKDPDGDLTFMDYEIWKSKEYYKYSNWKVKKFAGALKQICSILTGIPVTDFEKQEVKDSFLGEEWRKVYCSECNIEKEYKNPNILPIGYYECPQCKVSGISNHKWQDMSVRTLLQKVGTECLRDNLHENVHVNALFSSYKVIDQEVIDTANGMEPELVDIYPKWILSDLRFPNELKAIKDRHGITIRITRPGTAAGTHLSETALDNSTFDYEILNNSTIEDLILKVKEILIKEHIIN